MNSTLDGDSNTPEEPEDLYIIEDNSASVLETALESPMPQWEGNPTLNIEWNEHGALRSVFALNYLALMAHQGNPDSRIKPKLLEMLRFVVAGGNEPTARGVIAGWADNCLAQSIALVKHTPQVWESISNTVCAMTFCPIAA